MKNYLRSKKIASLVGNYVKELEDIWRDSRWIMELISVARDKISSSSSSGAAAALSEQQQQQQPSSNRVIMFKDLESFFERIMPIFHPPPPLSSPASALFLSPSSFMSTGCRSDGSALQLLDKSLLFQHLFHSSSSSNGFFPTGEISGAGRGSCEDLINPRVNLYHHFHHLNHQHHHNNHSNALNLNHDHFQYHHIDSISVDDDDVDYHRYFYFLFLFKLNIIFKIGYSFLKKYK